MDIKEFNLKDLLNNSLFYPACDIDGGVVRYCTEHYDRLGIDSFVYADYAVGRDRLIENLDTFRGYHLLTTRELKPSDVGADRPIPMPRGIRMREYRTYQRDWQPFGRWAVYERAEGFDADHGPEHFSLLYLGAEGTAAYAGLYLNNAITPKALAVIQPGHAFGLNWTNFTNPNEPFTQTLYMGHSMPEYIFYGGLGYDRYDTLPWTGYQMIDRVDHYYSMESGSSITVWKAY